jgi:hypothetical protein
MTPSEGRKSSCSLPVPHLDYRNECKGFCSNPHVRHNRDTIGVWTASASGKETDRAAWILAENLVLT